MTLDRSLQIDFIVAGDQALRQFRSVYRSIAHEVKCLRTRREAIELRDIAESDIRYVTPGEVQLWNHRRISIPLTEMSSHDH